MLQNRVSVPKYCLLQGDRHDGKSTLLKVLKAILGRSAVSSIPWQALEHDRFAAVNLGGKHANIFYDLPEGALKSTSVKVTSHGR